MNNRFFNTCRKLIGILLLFCTWLGEFALTGLKTASHVLIKACSTFVKWFFGCSLRVARRLGKVFSGIGRRIFDYTRRSARGFVCAGKAAYQNFRQQGVKAGILAFWTEVMGAVRRHRRMVRRTLNYMAPAAAVFVLILTVSSFSNVTLALEVNYSGNTIGYISDEAVYSEASQLVSQMVEGDATQIATTPSYSVRLVSQDQLDNADTLSDAILRNSGDSVKDGYGLYVDGTFFAAASREPDVSSVLSELIAEEMKTKNAQTVEFQADMQIRKGLFLKKDILKKSALKTKIAQADFPMVVSVLKTVTKEIPFETVTLKDNTKYTTYSYVEQQGKNGKQESVIEIQYLDGVEILRSTVSSKTVTEPVDKQVIVGTRKVSASAAQSSAQFFWPVEKVSRSYVSSYFGAGRNHKGIDIAAPQGTDIYAAMSGTVVEIEYSNSGYGNHLVIDHGNGYKTLYAHCSAIHVEVGQKVNKGELIADVGSTGNSTGPHCHFEIRKNGTQMDPAPYLGL